MQAYEQDLMNGGTASKTSGDYSSLMRDLENLGYSAKQAAQLIQMVTNNINAVPANKTSTITVNTRYVTSGGGTGIPNGVRAPGYATGTPSASPGWAWVNAMDLRLFA